MDSNMKGGPRLSNLKQISYKIINIGLGSI